MLISSKVPSPQTTKASLVPSLFRTRAIFSVKSSSYTPRTRTEAPAGLVTGPKRLKMLRIPISFLGPAACFMAPWNRGANRKPIPISLIHLSTSAGVISRFTPRFSRTSALPHMLDTALLPCFATLRPAPAATKAVVVETLKVRVPSPPVPTISRIVSSSILISSRSMLTS